MTATLTAPSRARSGLAPQIRSEWVKVRSVRSTLWMLVAAIGLSMGVAAIVAIKSNSTLQAWDALIGVQIASLFFTVLGVQVIGQEYRFNTIRPTFSTVSSRTRVIAAKLAVLLGSVAVTAAALMAGSIAVASVIAKSRGIGIDLGSIDTNRVLIGTFLSTLLSAAFGYGVGAIIRQPIAGIMVALLWSLVVENILLGLLPSVAKWLPLNSAANTVLPEIDDKLLSPLAGGVYSTVVIIALTVIGCVRIARTDA